MIKLLDSQDLPLHKLKVRKRKCHSDGSVDTKNAAKNFLFFAAFFIFVEKLVYNAQYLFIYASIFSRMELSMKILPLTSRLCKYSIISVTVTSG